MANQALAMAKRMATKKTSDGGKCYACDGVTKMADGGMVDEPMEDGVDDFGPESLADAADDDSLEYSPEVAEGDVDNEEDGGDNEAKRANFLKAYLIHRKVRRA